MESKIECLLAEMSSSSLFLVYIFIVHVFVQPTSIDELFSEVKSNDDSPYIFDKFIGLKVADCKFIFVDSMFYI